MLGAVLAGIIGRFLGVAGFCWELSLQRSPDQAGRAGFGAAAGMTIAVADKPASGIAMVGIFIYGRSALSRLSLYSLSQKLKRFTILVSFPTCCSERISRISGVYQVSKHKKTLFIA